MTEQMGSSMRPPEVYAFVGESNLIEGISRATTVEEIDATVAFLKLERVLTVDVCALQRVYAPRKPLRTRVGMDVRVGNYIAPAGGPEVAVALDRLVGDIGVLSPWHTHVAFEALHPFLDGNGRTGRALWAWHMLACGQDPFALSFLHRFYYQTLENSNGR